MQAAEYHRHILRKKYNNKTSLLAWLLGYEFILCFGDAMRKYRQNWMENCQELNLNGVFSLGDFVFKSKATITV